MARVMKTVLFSAFLVGMTAVVSGCDITFLAF